MPISAEAARVLDLIGDERRNLQTLAGWAELEDTAFERAVAELTEAGLVRRVGGRVERLPTHTGAAEAGGRGEDFPEIADTNAKLLFEALKEDGSLTGAGALRSMEPFDAWTNEEYERAREYLKDRDLIRSRGGRSGGSLGRIISEQADEEDARPGEVVDRERDLYEAFREWYESNIDKATVVFSEVIVTGDLRGGAFRRGKWAIPDVTAVTVTNNDWLPGATLVVASFEIKRWAEANDIKAVYEAAAQRRWAHESSLVVEKPREVEGVGTDVRALVDQFGLGLYTISADEDNRRIFTEERVPDRVEPGDDEDLRERVEQLAALWGQVRAEEYKRALRP